jgi:D-aminopeptidase
LGLKVGILPTGPLNAITDVAGVAVGHATIIKGDDIRTGVTAVVPHSGNLYRDKVPGAIFVGNGFGKLAGSTQVDEMGDIETPILLTSTTSVPRVADALISYMLALPGNEDVVSINPIVGETNDGYLNDIRGRHVTPEDVFAAVKNARGGPVEEGAVGAGTGTVALVGRAASARPRDVCLPNLAGTQSVFLFKRILVACSRSTAGPLDKSWTNTTCARNSNSKAAGQIVETDRV